MFGIYVDDELVLCVAEQLKRGEQHKTWSKVRDAVWSKFSPYNRPDCNGLYESGTVRHNGITICIKRLPT